MRIHFLCIQKKAFVYTQEVSCACTPLLHALGQGPPRPGLKKSVARALGRPERPFWALAQSMHESVLHAQEIACVYTRDF